VGANLSAVHEAEKVGFFVLSILTGHLRDRISSSIRVVIFDRPGCRPYLPIGGIRIAVILTVFVKYIRVLPEINLER